MDTNSPRPFKTSPLLVLGQGTSSARSRSLHSIMTHPRFLVAVWLRIANSQKQV